MDSVAGARGAGFTAVRCLATGAVAGASGGNEVVLEGAVAFLGDVAGEVVAEGAAGATGAAGASGVDSFGGVGGASGAGAAAAGGVEGSSVADAVS